MKVVPGADLEGDPYFTPQLPADTPGQGSPPAVPPAEMSFTETPLEDDPVWRRLPVVLTTIVVIALAWAGDIGSSIVALIASGILKSVGVAKLQDWPMHAPALVGASFLSWAWCLTIIGLLGCWLHRQSLKAGLRFRNPGGFQISLSLVLGVLMASVGACISFRWGRTDTMMAKMTSTPEGLFWIALLAIPIGGAEEIYYRGFIFPRLRRGMQWLAQMVVPEAARLLGGLAATGVIVLWFGLIHLQQLIGGGTVDWLSLSMVTFAGLVFTVQRWTTDSIVPSLITHVTYNTTLIGLALLPI